MRFLTALRRPSVLSRHLRAAGFSADAAKAAPSMELFEKFPHPAGFMDNLRNIGISAHIDSGKTTLTERILFYTGRINAIHDVRGKDGVGAKMDSMDLEREKGITIQSAATYATWKTSNINIIDTPGHVDFTIEVERALRVLDGGILVLCGVSGVQSQSLTVDKQMKRYGVPRIAFINKLDRMGANPWKVVGDLRKQLKLNAAAVQIPIGAEDALEGVVDLVKMQVYRHEGPSGETIVVSSDIPEELKELAAAKRQEMIERLADVDDEIGELFLMEEEPTVEQLQTAIRKATIAHKFVPVFMGSAFKNKGVQPMLDGVLDYLPSPHENQNIALDQSNNEQPVVVPCSPDAPLLALAFKLEEGRFGQLTYMRIYSGTLKRGGFMYNMSNGKRIKVPRLVKMHSNEMEDVDEVTAGEVVAMFGVECASMDTFCDSGSNKLTLTSLHVPEPVMSLAIIPNNKQNLNNFSKSLNRFQREDPTFRVRVDDDSKQTIISGMGELHLQIYIERMKREYNVEVESGAPQVNYRETVRQKADFNYLHKKQSGGSGQYARVTGYVEPISDEEIEAGEAPVQFQNDIIGNAIPPEYIQACEKGVNDAVAKGWLLGHPITRLRVVITDGQAHAVDSSELAFRTAMVQAIRAAFTKANPSVLEPLMTVEVDVPNEFQGGIIAELNRRRGMIQSSEADETTTVIRADVPLQNMFGFSTDLRSSTQGKGEFTMEYKTHDFVARDAQEKLVAEYQKELAAKNK
ncbi:translation elongation factor G [Saprolegnia parasitica CBS 223.65]|uniref:Elongation factor G, mitochondrial n=1 Tax=Saprolegnia parasitica (strain CBS 223.65) TaxID=695850 RepID=A0A067C2C1_SAPPC|nr:translation elongation factor G [Saprolegnia parasitica CBS 223.65]KDO24663.1 translation elongation factor G [Saprolegnia parasitica CBS 223.65]|eukprot:XP_012204544.1 translation elongation factor G [Saprolegnia parasitica CBS 223.65]